MITRISVNDEYAAEEFWHAARVQHAMGVAPVELAPLFTIGGPAAIDEPPDADPERVEAIVRWCSTLRGWLAPTRWQGPALLFQHDDDVPENADAPGYTLPH